ncbi:MAG: hypothetical protein AABY14_04255, partial [Nanoarchaeota archaeon]
DKSYKPTMMDIDLDIAIVKGDTLKTNTDSWETLNNSVFRNSANLYWEGGIGRFYSWVDNGTQPSIEFVKPSPEYSPIPIGITIDSHERLVNPVLDKYLTNSAMNCSPRDVGRLVSKVNNVKYIVETFLKSSDFEKLDRFLRGEGYEPKGNIEQYASGFLQERAIAGVGPISTNPNEKGIRLYLNLRYEDMLGNEARGYKIYILNVLKNTLRHEFVHLYGIKDEKTLEKVLVQFYDSIIKQLPDSNTTYGVGRDSIGKRVRQNLEDERKISAHREGIARKLYGRLNPKEVESIDDLVGRLKESGVSKEEISNLVSIYLSQNNEYNDTYIDEKSVEDTESQDDGSDNSEGTGSDRSGDGSE